ncbi:MAG: gamma-glutamylcyclotransferase [Acidimicrobiales bacterium]|nr:gamma-glutamylcyclotransferase [Acidimicrobiales bacterium]HRW36576.1 gamma-glutamylcyclotransferase [Aquihabitans sp.]
MPAESPDLLFVYGTLMPGHLRWGMLEGSASAWGPASVPGELWDTGHGWPAARFTAGSDRVPGWWVRFAPGVLERRLIAELDAMEGIGDPPDPGADPYVRRIVDLAGVGSAWVYHATRVEPGWRRIDRWAGRPEA